ncbi:MAG TPA: DUF2339 domain-containing protein [Pyrinomonadaceae bacterium]|nr:DUF2339 domain-containing protein [Pyrinomonadaceae bacterium]
MAEDNLSREAVERLVERLEHLERVLQANTARLHAVEEQLRAVSPPPPMRARQRRPTYETIRDERDEADASAAPPFVTDESAAPRERHAAESDAQAARESEAHQPPPQQRTPPPPRVTPLQTWGSPETAGGDSQKAREGFAPDEGAGKEAREPVGAGVGVGGAAKRRDFESVVGGSWFAWAGIIAITFGVAFILKLAFENEWIGPPVRVLLGALGGGALLVVGERLRHKGFRQYAYILSGGGVLILYLSIYAARAFYDLIGPLPAFALMAGVTALAVLLSVRLDALPVAVLGLVGGFLTPLLLSTGRDNQVGLFTYVALLDAGVLAVAYFKRWRSLNYLSFLATVLMMFGWMAEHYAKEKLWTTVFFLSLFFVLYSALAVVHNLLPRRASRWFDICLLAANATFYFGLSYLLLSDAGYAETVPASHALVVSAFYAGLFYAAWRLNRSDRLLSYASVGAAVTFFTVALAIQLELHWVTVAWAVEGLMLTWVGLRSGESAPRHAALAVFVVALQHWFMFDLRVFAFEQGAAFVPLLNRRALSCAALVGALAVGVALYRRAREIEEEERSIIITLFVLAGNALALTLLTFDVNDYFNRNLSRVALEQAEHRAWVENTRQFSLSVLWIFYGATALVLGLLRRLRLLRYGALLLLAAVMLKVLLVDTGFYAERWHVLVLNQTFMAYALLVLALAFCARFYSRSSHVEESERGVVVPALVVVANVLAFGALSLEAVGYYDRRTPDAGESFVTSFLSDPFNYVREGKAFALAVVWTLYGAGALLYGIGRRSHWWRYGGLAVLTLAAFKLLLWDVWYYDAKWHMPVFNRTLAAFALMVAALYLVVRAYTRAPEMREESSQVLPVLIVAANVMALIALSAEASGYFAAQMREEGLSEERLRDLRLASWLSLSVMWAVYGGALLLVGRMRRAQLLRVMALALLGLTTLKVFFWDLSSLDRAYRVVSFIVLGAILLAVSYLYQKSQRQQQRAAEAEGGGVE